jgi:hypothetical protein
MLLANHRLVRGIVPASQGLGDEADDGEEATLSVCHPHRQEDGVLTKRGK